MAAKKRSAVVAVLRAHHAVGDDALRRAERAVEHTVDDLALIGRERADDPVDNVVLRRADADLDARESVGAEVRDDVLEAVVSACASAR